MPALFFFGFRRIELRKEMQNPLEVYFEVCEEQLLNLIWGEESEKSPRTFKIR